MNCDHVRAELAEIATEDFGRLTPHLAACPGCSRLAAQISADERSLREAHLEFTETSLYDAWDEAVMVTEPPAPIRPEPLRRQRGHDASRDLAWAMASSVVALFGVLGLAGGGMVSDPYLGLLVTGVGLLPAVGGTLSTVLILLTGRGGRIKARTVASMFAGGGVAVVLSTLVVSSGFAAMALLRDAKEIEFDLPADDGVAMVEGDEEEEPDVGDGVADGVAPDPQVEPGSRPRPRPGAEPEPRPAPAAAPGPVGGGASIPMDVVEVMLYNNLGVKKCFVPLFKAGNIPNRVEVEFDIEPSGAVSNARLRMPETLRGGTFEQCMRMAVMAVPFPPHQNSTPQTVVFPFVLNR